MRTLRQSRREKVAMGLHLQRRRTHRWWKSLSQTPPAPVEQVPNQHRRNLPKRLINRASSSATRNLPRSNPVGKRNRSHRWSQADHPRPHRPRNLPKRVFDLR
uniref:(northern house mosquito) hypothetical protein n=1 Tax=Culex pipiens TaxID=7175 RepID=A0A8D8KIC9_CULPI